MKYGGLDLAITVTSFYAMPIYGGFVKLGVGEGEVFVETLFK